MLDEIEELDLVLKHYAVTWGLWAPKSLKESIWAGWAVRTKAGVKDGEDEDDSD
jgi:[phosphatase 2A protein]-leucine-carboxy methyltransferase